MYKKIIQSLLVMYTILHSSNPATIDPDCDFYQDIKMGKEYFIFNRNYPQNYTSSKNCRWSGKSPQKTIIVLSCTVDFPTSSDCQGYRLSFSLTGDKTLEDEVQNYCGKTAFTAFTYKNLLAVGLFPSTGSGKGKFLCSLAAMVVDQSLTCGLKSEKKIIGGQDTKTNEYPSMGTLKDLTLSDLNFPTVSTYCGASIISSRYAVTSAHCVWSRRATQLRLLVGDHDLTSENETKASVLYRVQLYKSHSLYNRFTNHNDIAVVKTVRIIQFSLAVSPVCLPFRYGQFSFVSETVTALGWGLKHGGERVDILQKLDLTVVTNKECDHDNLGQIDSTRICTYSPGKGACTGDFGGPLLWQDSSSKKLELVGIISFGYECDTDKPVPNTRVTSFLPWIASVTADAAYPIY